MRTLTNALIKALSRLSQTPIEVPPSMHHKTLKIQAIDAPMVIHVRIHETGIELIEPRQEADASLYGNAVDLAFSILTPPSMQSLMQHNLTFEGDLGVLTFMHQLMKTHRPDLTQMLATLTNDWFAQTTTEVVKKQCQEAGAWASRRGEDFGEYMAFDAALLVSQQEFDEFKQAITKAKDDVEKLKDRFEGDHS